MNRKLTARCLAELGNLTRLDIYRLLVRSAPRGLSITELQARLGVPMSTLVFHLRGLVSADIVLQEKIGREVICRANFRQVSAVVEFLRAHCCKGGEDEPLAAPARRAG